MAEIVIISFVIVAIILLAIYLILNLIFKGLNRTFTGRIVLGVIFIGAGIFFLIALPSFFGSGMETLGLIMIVLAIIWILLEVLLQKKEKT